MYTGVSTIFQESPESYFILCDSAFSLVAALPSEAEIIHSFLQFSSLNVRIGLTLTVINNITVMQKLCSIPWRDLKTEHPSQQYTFQSMLYSQTWVTLSPLCFRSNNIEASCFPLFFMTKGEDFPPGSLRYWNHQAFSLSFLPLNLACCFHPVVLNLWALGSSTKSVPRLPWNSQAPGILSTCLRFCTTKVEKAGRGEPSG